MLLNAHLFAEAMGWVAGGAGVLVVVPLLVGLVVSRLLAEPFFEVAQRYNPEVFALTDKKKVEGAKEVHKHELRLRMDAALGRAPPITEPELQARSLSPSACMPQRLAGRRTQVVACNWQLLLCHASVCRLSSGGRLSGWLTNTGRQTRPRC